VSTGTRKSPESEEMENFQEFSRRHLPTLVEANLNPIIQAKHQVVQTEIKNVLGDIARTSLSTLFKKWKQSNSVVSSTVDNKDGSTLPPSLDEPRMGAEYVPTDQRGESNYALSQFFESPPTSDPKQLHSDSSETLEDLNRIDSTPDSLNLGYSSLEPYPCICATPLDPIPLQSFKESVPIPHLEPEFPSDFASGATFPCDEPPAEYEYQNYISDIPSRGKGKGIARNEGDDDEPQFCQRCIGIVVLALTTLF
jgi:hypothetical protein